MRVAFSMTINKSQGQTVGGKCGVFLPESVFSHGQLYVALSRATDPTRLILAVAEVEAVGEVEEAGITRNVVFNQIFS